MQRRTATFALALGLALMFASSAALAQYQLTNLSSNQVKAAHHDDPLLVNAWGLVHAPGSPWWVSDNNSGWATLYDGAGNLNAGLKVSIPTAGNGPDSPTGLNGPGSPTGIVWNGTSEFQLGGWPTFFLFATLDGTISGWAPQANFNQAILGADTTANKNPHPAVYTGLAITNNASGNLLYAADMANSRVDVYNGTFTPVILAAGAFTDPSIPAGFAPFGIQDINGVVYVTFASTTGASGGFVVQFKEDGTPVTPGRPLIHGAPLNQPWGVTLAPRNFGALSNTVLVSNNTNIGTINAFDIGNGHFVGTVKDVNGKAIVIDQPWAIGFGDGLGKNGAPNQLFFTAGPGNNLAGTFGRITVAP